MISPRRLLAVSAALTALGATCTVWAATPATARTAQLTVSPHTGLQGGQQVSVVVHGFPGGQKVWLSECATAMAANGFGCGVELAGQPFLITSNRGVGRATFVVRNHAWNGPVNDHGVRRLACGDRCVLVASNGIDQPFATAALDFSDTPCTQVPGSPPLPCLVMTPSNGPAGTRVRFTGFVPAKAIHYWAEQWASRGRFELMYADFGKSAQFPIGCELDIAAEPLTIHLDRAIGRVRGSFTVGDSGQCFQNGGTIEADRTHLTQPALYNLVVGQSLSTVMAQYRVTGPSALNVPVTGAPPTAWLVTVGLLTILGGIGLLEVGRGNPTARAR